MIKIFWNTKGLKNPLSGSKVTAILPEGWILPFGGASVVEGLRLHPAQQAFLFMDTFKYPAFLNAKFEFLTTTMVRKSL